MDKDIDFNVALGVSAKQLVAYSIQNYYARVRLTKTYSKGIQTVAFLQAKEADVGLPIEIITNTTVYLKTRKKERWTSRNGFFGFSVV